MTSTTRSTCRESWTACRRPRWSRLARSSWASATGTRLCRGATQRVWVRPPHGRGSDRAPRLCPRARSELIVVAVTARAGAGAMQRQLDCDIFVSGHTHRFSAYESGAAPTRTRGPAPAGSRPPLTNWAGFCVPPFHAPSAPSPIDVRRRKALHQPGLGHGRLQRCAQAGRGARALLRPHGRAGACPRMPCPAPPSRAGGTHGRAGAGAGARFRAPRAHGSQEPANKKAPIPPPPLCRQGVNVVTYVYELHGEEVKVKKIEHTKSQPQAA